MKRNTQRQVSHQKTVQSRLRLREAKLAKNMISEAEREKRQAINDVTRMQNNKHLLEVELNRRANRARKNAETVSQSKKELAKEKLHAGGLNTRIAALRRRATVEREQAEKIEKNAQNRIKIAEKKVTNKNENIGLKQSEINKAKVNLNAASKKAGAYKKSTDSALAKIQELTKKLEAAGNAGNSEKVKTLETQITKLLKELEELKKKPVTVVQNADLIAKKIELTRLAGVHGVNFSKNINSLTMNNVRGTVLKNNFGKNTQIKLAPTKVLTLETKIKTAGEKKKKKKNTELAAIETKRREEMNIIRAEKEKAITNAARNKARAVNEAEAAAKAKVMANTAEERAKAQANLQAAQVKISAANEEKTKALEKATEEREQALTTAASNKEAALVAAKTAANANKAAALTQANSLKRRRMFESLLNEYNVSMNKRITLTKRFEKGNRISAIAAELKKEKANKNKAATNANKTAALANAAKKAKANRITATRNAAQKARNRQKAESEAKLNQIREEKNKALAEAAANKNKAQFEANAARKALVAGRFQSAANKAALEKKVTEAEAGIKRAATEKVEALEEAERKRKEALEEAERNKKNAIKGAVAFNRMKGAINAKKNARTSIENRLRAKAQQARNTVEKRKKAQAELRALAKTKGVNFTSNINRVTLNGVNTLKTRIKNAGKYKRIAKAKTDGETTRLERQKANENKRKQNARNAEVNKAATARRIALEKKQAAAKQRRELQEQGRGKRIAEKNAAKANAKKEENNMKARMKATRNKLATNKAAANKAAEANKTKTKNLENLFSKYNAIMANNSGWPIRKDLVREQYRKGKTLERIKDELNFMVNFHRKKAVKGLVSGAIERVKNAEGKALGNARNAYRMKVNGGNKAGLFPTRQEVNTLLLQAKTAENMRTIQGYDKMLNMRLNELKREKNAATKIQAAVKGTQVRKSVGGSSMGQDILKKHISGKNVMAHQTIPGFNGKRVENTGYESGWLNRVDKEGDTAVKRAKLRKMFDDKFELRKTLLKHENTNVRTGYRLQQLQSLKRQVMRPFSKKKYDSTKGTNKNEAILNAARIEKQIEEATNTHAKKILNQQPINMKKAGQKFKTYNNPISNNTKMPKKTTSNPLFKTSGGFNGGIRLGEGRNRAINGSNVNITLKKAKPVQGPTVMKLGVQAAVAKNKLGKTMTNVERRVAARKAAEATGRLGGRMAQQRNNTFRTKGMTAGAIAKASVNRAKKAEKIAAKRAAKKAK